MESSANLRDFDHDNDVDISDGKGVVSNANVALRRLKRRQVIIDLIAKFRVESKAIPDSLRQLGFEVFNDSLCDNMSKRTFEKHMFLARSLLRG